MYAASVVDEVGTGGVPQICPQRPVYLPSGIREEAYVCVNV